MPTENGASEVNTVGLIGHGHDDCGCETPECATVDRTGVEDVSTCYNPALGIYIPIAVSPGTPRLNDKAPASIGRFHDITMGAPGTDEKIDGLSVDPGAEHYEAVPKFDGILDTEKTKCESKVNKPKTVHT